MICINGTQRIRVAGIAVAHLATAAATIAVLLAAGTAAAQKGALFPGAVEPQLSADLSVGKTNYEARCASCHGKTARGSDRGPTFISRIYHPGHHGDAAFLIAPRQGVRAHHWRFGDMPPVPGVSDAELQSILRYVRAVQRANGVF